MKNKQKQYSRRGFIEKTALAGAAGLITPGLNIHAHSLATPHMTYDDISLAQWALVDEIRQGKWKNLDFPRKKFKATLSHARYDLKTAKKKTVNLMNDLIADTKSKIPVEHLFNTSFVPFATALIPGLGQLIYGQKKKALLMSFISLFIYIIYYQSVK